MPVHWSSPLGIRVFRNKGPVRQLGWAKAVQDHGHLHRKPPQSVLTSESKLSTDTPAMDVHGTSLVPRETYFPRLQTARPTLEFFHPRAGPGSNLSTSTHIWMGSVWWELAPVACYGQWCQWAALPPALHQSLATWGNTIPFHWQISKNGDVHLFSALVVGQHHQNNWKCNYTHMDSSIPSPVFSRGKQNEEEFSPLYLIFSLWIFRERKYEIKWSAEAIVPINLQQNKTRYSVYWGKLNGKWWCRTM